MKKTLYIIVLLISFLGYSQTPFTSGLRLPNAPESDTLSSDTRIPILQANSGNLMNKYIKIGSLPFFTPSNLLTDYGFTDNSADWNTAFSWGDWATGVNQAFVEGLGFSIDTGDVTKVGTPVNGQVGIWTGDGTIEGNPKLTFDPTSSTLSVGLENINAGIYQIYGSNGSPGGILGIWNGITAQDDDLFYKWQAYEGVLTLQGSNTGPIYEYTSSTQHLNLASNTIQFSSYGSGTNTGTPAYTLQVDSSGNIIEGSLGSGSDDQIAVEVAFTPYSTIAATNVQDAIEEVIDESNGDMILATPQTVTGTKTHKDKIIFESETNGYLAGVKSNDAGYLEIGDTEAQDMGVKIKGVGGSSEIYLSDGQTNIVGDVNIDSDLLADSFKTPSGTADDILLANGTTTPLSGIGGGASYDEWATFTGSTLGGDVNLILGDHENGGNGTTYQLNDSANYHGFHGDIIHYAASGGFSLNNTEPTLTDDRTRTQPDASGMYALEADPSGFDGNLANTDNTLQEIAQKFDDYVSSGTDDQTATEVSITDVGGLITATNVEDALQENRTAINLNTAKETNATHSGEVIGSTSLVIASSVVDSDNIVNSTIDETDLDTSINSSLDLADTALQTEVDGSVTNELQDADEVPFTPYSTIAATNTQNAIQELLDEVPTSLAAANITVSPSIGGETDAYAVMDEHQTILEAYQTVLEALTPVFTTTAPSQVIALDKIGGTFYTTSEYQDTYTLTGSVDGAFAELAIDTTGETVFPAVTGATLWEGATFEAAENFSLVVRDIDGTRIYFFLKR